MEKATADTALLGVAVHAAEPASVAPFAIEEVTANDGGGVVVPFDTCTVADVSAFVPSVAVAAIFNRCEPFASVVVFSLFPSPLKMYGEYCSVHFRAPSM